MRLLRIIFRHLRASSTKRPYIDQSTRRTRSDYVVLHREKAIRYAEKAKYKVTTLKGRCWVIDGDTIVIDNVRIRLAGIDAPELDHPWGQKSKWALVQLCKGKIITAHIRPDISHDRVVADCVLPDGRDLAAELVQAGLALDWTKYSGGKYRHLETP